MIVDVAGVSRVEPAGAAEWRSFVQQVTPLVEQLYLVGVPPAFLEKLCGRDDLGAKAQVVDFTLPYACGACGTTSAQPIDVAEHHDVLKFATAPELRCPSCKAAMQCAASEATMTILPGLPKPSDRQGARSARSASCAQRKLDKRPTTGLVAGRRELRQLGHRVGTGRCSRCSLVVVATGGLAFYLQVRARRRAGPVRARPGRRAQRRRTARVDQGRRDTRRRVVQRRRRRTHVRRRVGDLAEPGRRRGRGERRRARGGRVRARQARDRQGVARRGRADLHRGARRASSPRWRAIAQSTQARRDVRDGRHAVALAIARRSTAGRARATGRRTTRATAGATSRSRRSRSRPATRSGSPTATRRRATALGATALPLFPELGWRFPKLDHGAVDRRARSRRAAGSRARRALRRARGRRPRHRRRGEPSRRSSTRSTRSSTSAAARCACSSRPRPAIRASSRRRSPASTSSRRRNSTGRITASTPTRARAASTCGIGSAATAAAAATIRRSDPPGLRSCPMNAVRALVVIAAMAGVARAQPTPELTKEFQAGVDAFRLGQVRRGEARTSRRRATLDPKLPGPHRFLAAVAKAQGRWQDCIDERARGARGATRCRRRCPRPASSTTSAARRRAACRIAATSATSAAIAVTTNVPGADDEDQRPGLRRDADRAAPDRGRARSSVDARQARLEAGARRIDGARRHRHRRRDRARARRIGEAAELHVDATAARRPRGWLVSRAARGTLAIDGQDVAHERAIASSWRRAAHVVEVAPAGHGSVAATSADRRRSGAPRCTPCSSTPTRREHPAHVGLAILGGGGAACSASASRRRSSSEHAADEARDIERVETARDPAQPLLERVEPVRTRADFDAARSRASAGR